MDPIEIEGPDGVVNEFPAGTSDDDIQKAMAAQYGGPQLPEPTTRVETSPVDDFVRGVDRIAGTQFSGSKQRPVSLEEYGREAENTVRSLTAPLGGDYLAAGGSFVAGKGYNPDEQRARREELADRNAGSKTAALAAEALGAGAVGKVIKPLSGVIPKTPFNLARIGAQGGITGAVTGANLSGGDPVETVKSAVLGAAGGKLIEKVGEAFSPLAALAKRLKVNVNDLAATWNSLKAARGGRPPSLVELLKQTETEGLQKLAQRRGGETMKAFENAQEADVLTKPARLEADIAQGKPVTGVDEQIALRDDAFKAAMDPIRNKPILLDAQLAAQIAAPEVDAVVSQSMRNRINNAVASGKPAFVTVGEMDTVRRQLGDAASAAQRVGAQRGGLTMEELAGLRDTVEAFTASKVSKYGAALDDYRLATEVAEGAQKGATVTSPKATGDLVEAAARAKPGSKTGMEIGARKALSEAAGDSPQSALRTAQTLTSPGGQARVAATLGQSEASRLATSAEGELRAAKNLADITRVAPKEFAAEEAGNLAVDLGAMAATGAKSAGVSSRVAKGLITQVQKLGLGYGVGRKIAELATSADGAEKVIDFLRKSKVGDTAIQKIARAIGVPYGAVAGAE